MPFYAPSSPTRSKQRLQPWSDPRANLWSDATHCAWSWNRRNIRRGSRRDGMRPLIPTTGSCAPNWKHGGTRLSSRAEDLERGLKDIESTPRPTSIPNREVLLSLAQDLPGVWNTSSDMGLKQRIARILIEEIAANIDMGTNEVVLVVHWAGGRHTELRVRRPKNGEHGRRTDTEALEIIKQMAGQFPDELIAATLNRLGLKTGAGNPWKKNRVCSLRSKLNLPTYDPAAPTTTVTAAQAAQRLGIDARMVHELLRQKVIQGRQIVPYAPWQIPVEALDSPGVRERVRQIKEGDRARRPISVDTQTMILPGIE
jgi:hypothetical protein